MNHEKTARALVRGAARYVDERLAAIVERVANLESRMASAEFARAQFETTAVAEARASARKAASASDDWINGGGYGTH